MIESVGNDTEHFGMLNEELQKHEYSRKMLQDAMNWQSNQNLLLLIFM